MKRRRFLNLKLSISNFFRQKGNYHQPDMLIIAVVLILVVFGLIMLSSASSAISYVRFGSVYHFLNRQIIGVFLGLLVFYISSRFDYHRYKNIAVPLLIFSITLLILVFLPWFEPDWVGSAQSWIKIPIIGLELQPSEIVKLTFLLYLAAWVEKRGADLTHLHHGTMPFLIVLGIISLLMLLQPDVGTLFIILTISLSVYFVAGGNLRYIFYIIIGGITGLLVMFKVFPKQTDYQLGRLRCFFDISFDPTFYCYQINQALIAIGSGGLLGRGFGASRQKFLYIPEVHGDAIFPIISEELGFIISIILVASFAFLFYRGYLIAKKAPDKYGQVIAIGIVSWLAFQAFINIAGMINLIPMTGVPLPFISQGGSAMIVNLAAIGILVNISKQTKP